MMRASTCSIILVSLVPVDAVGSTEACADMYWDLIEMHIGQFALTAHCGYKDRSIRNSTSCVLNRLLAMRGWLITSRHHQVAVSSCNSLINDAVALLKRRYR